MKIISKSPYSPRGFTLVEILVVMVIIAMLGGIMMVVGKNISQKAKIQNTKNTMVILMGAVEAYQAYKGHYPQDIDIATLEGVPDSRDILSKLPESAKILHTDGKIRVIDYFNDGDTQGKLLNYYNTPGDGNPPILSSHGPDRQEGSADDIVSTDF